MSSSEVVLVTGANTGIGYEIIRALAGSDKPYSIILAGRSLDKVDQAIKDAQKHFPDSKSTLSPLQLDIESDKSIEAAFESVKSQFGRVDALINNAGASFDPQIGKSMTMREAWNRMWDVNTAGTQVMTHTFIPLLLASSSPRLLFMASGTSSLSRTEGGHLPVNQPGKAGWPKQGFSVAGYRSSKAGMNMMAQEWHRLLQNDGVKVWMISPGFLATGLGGMGPEALKKQGAQDPADAAQWIVGVLQGTRDADVGRVINKNGIQDW